MGRAAFLIRVSPEPLSGWQDGRAFGRGHEDTVPNESTQLGRAHANGFPSHPWGGLDRVPGALPRWDGNARCYRIRNSPFTQQVSAGLPNLFGQSRSYRTVRCGQRKPPSGSAVIHRLRGGPASGNF